MFYDDYRVHDIPAPMFVKHVSLLELFYIFKGQNKMLPLDDDGCIGVYTQDGCVGYTHCGHITDAYTYSWLMGVREIVLHKEPVCVLSDVVNFTPLIGYTYEQLQFLLGCLNDDSFLTKLYQIQRNVSDILFEISLLQIELPCDAVGLIDFNWMTMYITSRQRISEPV